MSGHFKTPAPSSQKQKQKQSPTRTNNVGPSITTPRSVKRDVDREHTKKLVATLTKMKQNSPAPGSVRRSPLRQTNVSSRNSLNIASTAKTSPSRKLFQTDFKTSNLLSSSSARSSPQTTQSERRSTHSSPLKQATFSPRMHYAHQQHITRTRLTSPAREPGFGTAHQSPRGQLGSPSSRKTASSSLPIFVISEQELKNQRAYLKLRKKLSEVNQAKAEHVQSQEEAKKFLAQEKEYIEQHKQRNEDRHKELIATELEGRIRNEKQIRREKSSLFYQNITFILVFLFVLFWLNDSGI